MCCRTLVSQRLYLILDVPGSGDGAEVAGRHQHGAEKPEVVRLRDVESVLLHQREEVVSLLEVECQVCRYDCVFHIGYHCVVVLSRQVGQDVAVAFPQDSLESVEVMMLQCRRRIQLSQRRFNSKQHLMLCFKVPLIFVGKQLESENRYFLQN